MIVLTASTTGGHLYPAIALAQELGEENTAIIGSTYGRGEQIVNAYNIPFYGIFVKHQRPWTILFAFFKANALLKKLRPQKVVATGGFVTAPVILAARFQKIPVILLEQNVLPGRVNRLMARFAKQVILSFEESQKYFKNSFVSVLGNPVRKHFLPDETVEQILQLKLPKRPHILVVGGSQGAAGINQFFEKNMSPILNWPYTVIHLTGRGAAHAQGSFELIRDSAGEIKLIRLPYSDSMDQLYAWADLVIARAGATTLSELIAFGKKAILIPFPQAKDDHQTLNAKWFEKAGFGSRLEENTLSLSQVQNTIDHWLKAPVVQNSVSTRFQQARTEIGKRVG